MIPYGVRAADNTFCSGATPSAPSQLNTLHLHAGMAELTRYERVSREDRSVCARCVVPRIAMYVDTGAHQIPSLPDELRKYRRQITTLCAGARRFYTAWPSSRFYERVVMRDASTLRSSRASSGLSAAPAACWLSSRQAVSRSWYCMSHILAAAGSA
jgi:hypothetical protein